LPATSCFLVCLIRRASTTKKPQEKPQNQAQNQISWPKLSAAC